MIQVVGSRERCLLSNFFVVVDSFVHVDIKLPVVLVANDELPGNLILLRVRLFKNALGDDVTCGVFGDYDLSKAVADVAQSVGDETEARVVENFFLDAENDSELGLGAHFAEVTQKF